MHTHCYVMFCKSIVYACIVPSRTFYITCSVGIYQCMVVVAVSLSVDTLLVPLYCTSNKLLSLMRGPSHSPLKSLGKCSTGLKLTQYA